MWLNNYLKDHTNINESFKSISLQFQLDRGEMCYTIPSVSTAFYVCGFHDIYYSIQPPTNHTIGTALEVGKKKHKTGLNKIELLMNTQLFFPFISTGTASSQILS